MRPCGRGVGCLKYSQMKQSVRWMHVRTMNWLSKNDDSWFWSRGGTVGCGLCNPIRGTELWPHTPGAVRPSSTCLYRLLFCVHMQVDATADVQWHCNHRPPPWYDYFAAQSTLGADFLVYLSRLLIFQLICAVAVIPWFAYLELATTIRFCWKRARQI